MFYHLSSLLPLLIHNCVTKLLITSDFLGLVHPLHALPGDLLVSLHVQRLERQPGRDNCDHDGDADSSSRVSVSHHLLRR